MTTTPTLADAITDLPYAFGTPPACGRLRTTPEDFQVDEQIGFTPDGAGEHALLHIRKRNTNTDFLARQLARHAGVKAADVSYAGLKDRNAVTTQWFSVHLPGRDDPDWQALASEDVQFVAITRHSRKLRRGALTGNRFRLVVRDVEGERAAIEARLTVIRDQGVPNYFGGQRFGHAGNNLARAAALFDGARIKDRHQRGLYLSAARSYLFNRVLARRVHDGNWNQAIDGDVMMLKGTHSIFAVEQVDATIAERVARMDIHPTGPLWGRGRAMVTGMAAGLETDSLLDHALWRQGLEQAGLTQERRALRLRVADLGWSWSEDASLVLQFMLPAGAYATAVLRELVLGTQGSDMQETPDN